MGNKSTVCKYQEAERQKEKGQYLFHLVPKSRMRFPIEVGFTESECHVMKGRTVSHVPECFMLPLVVVSPLFLEVFTQRPVESGMGL